ncbi:MAG: hypothetical protein NT116_01300, partial [Candidatus Parcubacteria bacterium]|nr:hypothetical protein [Candidatus Parcubacteria bacterium]
KFNKIVEIRTNGRNFKDSNFLREIIKAGTDEITVTLLSYKKEIHNNLTRKRESWQESMLGIKNLLACKNKINFGIVIVVSKYNLPTLYGTVDFLAKLGVKRLQFNLIDYNKEYLVCRFNDLEKKILNRAISRIMGTRISFAVYGFPYCFINSKFWKFIVEPRIQNEICVGTKDKDFNYIRTVQGKGKLKTCKKCSKYQECEGVWKSYPRLYGDKYLKPIP